MFGPGAIRAFECFRQAVLSQILPANKTGHASVPIQTHYRDDGLATGLAGSFNVEIGGAMTERVKQTPMIPALVLVSKKVRTAPGKPRLSRREDFVIPAFSRR